MGPSRVNPNTGQILDADMIFDADFLQFWKQEYENFTPEAIAAMTGGPLDLKSYQEAMQEGRPRRIVTAPCATCTTAWPASSPSARRCLAGPQRPTRPTARKLIMQGLKEVTMHEIGHTLGLRHNFKASTMLTLEEMNDPAKTKDTGLTALGDGLCSGQYDAQGHEAGRLLLAPRSAPTTCGPSSTATSRFPAAPTAKWPS